jgi:hypothetical protein
MGSADGIRGSQRVSAELLSASMFDHFGQTECVACPENTYFSVRFRAFRAAEGVAVEAVFIPALMGDPHVPALVKVIVGAASATLTAVYVTRSLRLGLELAGEQIIVRNLLRTCTLDGRHIRSADLTGEAIIAVGPAGVGWTTRCLQLQTSDSPGSVDATGTSWLGSEKQGEALTRVDNLRQRTRRAARGTNDCRGRRKRRVGTGDGSTFIFVDTHDETAQELVWSVQVVPSHHRRWAVPDVLAYQPGGCDRADGVARYDMELKARKAVKSSAMTARTQSVAAPSAWG